MTAFRAIMLVLVLGLLGCPTKIQQPQNPNVKGPCVLARFLHKTYPSFRELSCDAKAIRCVIDTANTDGGEFACDGRTLVPINISKRSDPCSTPAMGVDEELGTWVVLLNTVTYRLEDGGVDSYSPGFFRQAGDGIGVSVVEGDALTVNPASVVNDDYLRGVLLSGVKKCKPTAETAAGH